MGFSELADSKDIVIYLKKVLQRTGNKKKDKVYLYHYTNINVALSIIKNKQIWLQSANKMNDFMEEKVINSAFQGNKLHYSCFSKNNESLAMYKMYAPSPDGVMLSMSFDMAEKLIKNNDRMVLNIIRDMVPTDETVEAKMFWSSVCYKEIKTNKITVDTVFNENIKNPLNENELAGFIKLSGWDYEKEVRLCALLDHEIEEKLRVAINVSDEVIDNIIVTLCPEFDRIKNNDKLIEIKRICNNVNSSEYESLVDLGYKANIGIDSRIKSLEMVMKSIRNGRNNPFDLYTFTSVQENNDISSKKYDILRDALDWVTSLMAMGDDVSLKLENSLSPDNPDVRADRYVIFSNSLSDMCRCYHNEINKYSLLLDDIGSDIDLKKLLHTTIISFTKDIRELGELYLHKPDTTNSTDINNALFTQFVINIEKVQSVISNRIKTILSFETGYFFD